DGSHPAGTEACGERRHCVAAAYLLPARRNPLPVRGWAGSPAARSHGRRRPLDGGLARGFAPRRSPRRARSSGRSARSARAARRQRGGGRSRQAHRPLAELRAAADARRHPGRRLDEAAAGGAAQGRDRPPGGHARPHRAHLDGRSPYRGPARHRRDGGAPHAATRRADPDLRRGHDRTGFRNRRDQASGGRLPAPHRGRPIRNGRSDPRLPGL
ncbi:MAG: ABC transporter involved in cytochrome c biogenesis, CcmB subunit, partial [uncultured Sphingosinicella sp.]